MQLFRKYWHLNINENNIFWKIVKPMFSKKCFKRGSITFAKDDKILSENLEVVETFNFFFFEHSKKDEHIFRPGTSDWSGSYRGSSFKNSREIQKTD